MTTATPTRMGTKKVDALHALYVGETMTAPNVRDAIGYEGSAGTRMTHALLRDLVEAGWVAKKPVSQKAKLELRIGHTGRPPAHVFKITAAGKKALKAAA